MFSNLRSQYFVCIALYNCICIARVKVQCRMRQRTPVSALRVTFPLHGHCLHQPGSQKKCFHRLHAPPCTMHCPLCTILPPPPLCSTMHDRAPAGKNLALWPRGRAGAGIYVKSWTPTLCQMHLSRHRTVTNVTCSGGQAVFYCTKVDDRSCVYASKSKPSQSVG